MFRKLYPRVKVYGKLIREVPHWVTDKKIVNGDTNLSRDFNIIHLYTNTRLYDLNKYKWWR